MNTKLVGFIGMALVLFSVFGAFASANSDLQIEYLKIDGEEYETSNDTNEVLEVRRGEELPIRIRVLALADLEEVSVSAEIRGYDYANYEREKVFDISDDFDLDQDRTRTIDLDLEIPVLMDTGDYKLRIIVADANSDAYIISYNLDVEGTEEEDAVRIKEAYVMSGDEVLAGRAISSLVKVENIGQDDLDSVTLVASIPELGIRDVETLDELDADEQETFEEIVLRIPSDAASGVYEVVYEVKFDEFESTTASEMIYVINDEDEASEQTNEDKTYITVPNSQTIAAGSNGAVYPVMISNSGNSARSYTLNVQGVDAWGTVRIDPSATVVVPAGSSSTVFVYVTPSANTQSGDKFFKLSVASDDEVQDIPLSAVVIEGTDNEGATGNSWDGLKRTLEVGLIILVVILILVGLIVGFSKLRGNDGDEDDKTYY